MIRVSSRKRRTLENISFHIFSLSALPDVFDPLAEAVTLGNIALRVPYKRLLWNAEKMAFTNSEEANKLVRRQEYRAGWDKVIG